MSTRTKNHYLNKTTLLNAVIESKKQGKMTDELAQLLMLLVQRYSRKGAFVNYCVDVDTEALTQRGWVNGQDITEQDIILSYDTDTGNLVWSKIVEIYRNFEYDGMMHHLTAQGIDALVTPNHKFVSAERGLIPVEDIINNEHIVLMGNPVSKDVPEHSDYLVELVGWASTKGHYSTKSKNKHSIRISHKVGSKADRIREVLTHLHIPYKEYTNKQEITSFHCTGSIINDIHQIISPNKVLSPDFILSLTPNQRILLINTMVVGDGWINPNGDLSYTQKCNKHIDAFLMLCTLAGFTTHIRPVPSTTNYKIPYNNIYSTSSCTINDVVIYNTSYTQWKAEYIDFHGGKQDTDGRENKPNLPTFQYKGLVWCPMTEYGTFICRRNGKIYVTGNTYIDDMCSYALMMLVRTWKSFDPEKSNNPFSYFTQCIHHSFVQQLNIEKKQRNIRDLLLVEQGLHPSYKFLEEHSDNWADSESVDVDFEKLELNESEEKFQESDNIEDNTSVSSDGFRV